MPTTNARGFTLIELLVVIAIIGILSSVILASLNSARTKGRDARRISDLKQIQLALELYYDAGQTYPPGTSLTGLTPNYISTVPIDPVGATAYTYQALTSANAACGSGTCPGYVVRATTENTKPTGSWNTDVAGVSCDQTTEYCVRP